ncbi:MAG: glycosyltransferase family 4 protein [Polaribacter sp.]|uniref:glycosyltransferase family 4 protein n=1 Tax=Polaribacter sp. TaxID=1920175 RepID=UPI003262DDDE
MKREIKILVANVELPSKKIGSWTTRITKFISNNQIFDYILSPSSETDKNIFCKKRKYIIGHRRIRNFMFRNWIAKDYLKSAILLSKQTEKLTIVILDDVHLLEAFALNRGLFNSEINLIFSFHGFNLNAKNHILQKTDKILFQTIASYLSSKNNYFSFTPEVKIIGNGVDSSVFFPLEDKVKQNKKIELGFKKEEKIITWLANDRPIKGLHIFLKFAKIISNKYSNIRIVIIGTEKNISTKDITYLGRMPNNETAKYLQISDFFIFTTLCKEGFALSPIEALKCGNSIISTNIGSLPEALNNLKNILFVDKPNIVDEWVKAFDKLYNNSKENVSKAELDLIHNYFNWELKFKNAIL